MLLCIFCHRAACVFFFLLFFFFFFFFYLFFYLFFFFFFFNDTATTEIYTLSLHDALPIWIDDYGILVALMFVNINCHGIGTFRQTIHLINSGSVGESLCNCFSAIRSEEHTSELQSHWYISYAVFCLKKKKKKK